MKHIMLFEQHSDAMKMPENFDDFSFAWLPFDSNDSEKIQNIPDGEISLSELQTFIAEANIEEFKDKGIFIAHKKAGAGGFTRLISSGYSPLTFNISSFDDKYKKVNEFENVNPTENDIVKLAKGSSLLGRTDIFDDMSMKPKDSE